MQGTIPEIEELKFGLDNYNVNKYNIKFSEEANIDFDLSMRYLKEILNFDNEVYTLEFIEDKKITNSKEDTYNRKFQLIYKGVEVNEYEAWFKMQGNQVLKIGGKYAAPPNFEVGNPISAEQAIKIVKNYVTNKYKSDSTIITITINENQPVDKSLALYYLKNRFYYSYIVSTTTSEYIKKLNNYTMGYSFNYYVDANSGKIVGATNNLLYQFPKCFKCQIDNQSIEVDNCNQFSACNSIV